MAQAVAENGPVSVVVDASGFHHDKGGIYHDRICRNDPSGLNHAVLVLGTDQTIGLLKIVMVVVGEIMDTFTYPEIVEIIVESPIFQVIPLHKLNI